MQLRSIRSVGGSDGGSDGRHKLPILLAIIGAIKAAMASQGDAAEGNLCCS